MQNVSNLPVMLHRRLEPYERISGAAQFSALLSCLAVL